MTNTFAFDPAMIQQLTTQGLQPATPPDLSDLQIVVWTRTWNVSAGPLRCQIECSIYYTLQTQAFTFVAEATLMLLGRTLTFKKEFPISGDQQKQFDLPFGTKLLIDIHNWTSSPHQLACDLLARFKGGVIPYITVYQGRITASIPGVQEIQELCTLRFDALTVQALQSVAAFPVTVTEVRQPAQYGATYSQV